MIEGQHEWKKKHGGGGETTKGRGIRCKMETGEPGVKRDADVLCTSRRVGDG